MTCACNCPPLADACKTMIVALRDGKWPEEALTGNLVSPGSSNLAAPVLHRQMAFACWCMWRCDLLKELRQCTYHLQQHSAVCSFVHRRTSRWNQQDPSSCVLREGQWARAASGGLRLRPLSLCQDALARGFPWIGKGPYKTLKGLIRPLRVF